MPDIVREMGRRAVKSDQCRHAANGRHGTGAWLPSRMKLFIGAEAPAPRGSLTAGVTSAVTILAGCLLVLATSRSALAGAVYAGDSNALGSDYGANYVGGQRSTESNVGPIEPGTTVRWFTINGMPYSSHTEWYLTNSGGTAVDTDDLYAYYDPQVGVKFTTSGGYVVRAEIWVGDSWVQAHRFRVKVNRAPPAPDNLRVDSSSITDGAAKVLWDSVTDPDSDTVHYRVEYGGYLSSPDWTEAEDDTLRTYKTISGLAPDKRYDVRVRAFDSNGGVSGWTTTYNLFRTKPTETVDQPDRPSYSHDGDILVGESITFTTGGSTCNWGHSVEYRYDWGDGETYGWTTYTSRPHSYDDPGTFSVKVKARCRTNTSVESPWSDSRSVTVYRPKAGRIIGFSESPATFEGSAKRVYVHVKNDGRDDQNLIVVPSNIPSGWTVSPGGPNYQQTTVPYNTTNTSSFWFDITPPNADSSGSIKFTLEYDDPWTTDNTYLHDTTLSVSSLKPRPDLLMTALSVSPTSGYRGMSLGIESTTKNNGTATAGVGWNNKFVLRYYLGRSAGERWREIQSVELPSWELNGLGPGESDDHAISSWIIPNDLTPGSVYYIVAVPDPDDVIDERNNNETDSRSVAFTVLADTLTVRLYQLGGTVLSPPAGTRFLLYGDGGTATTQNGNPVTYTSPPLGNRLVEGYYSGTFWGYEFWNSQTKDLVHGANTVDLVRKYPYATQITLTDITSGAPGTLIWSSSNPPSEAQRRLPPGRTVRVDVSLKNDVPATPLDVKVRTVLDRDRSTSGWDVDTWTQYVRVNGSGGTGYATTTFTTSTTQGDYYFAMDIITKMANGNDQRTDSWDWSSSKAMEIRSDVPTATFVSGPKWMGQSQSTLNPGKRYTVTTRHVSAYGRNRISNVELTLDHPSAADISVAINPADFDINYYPLHTFLFDAVAMPYTAGNGDEGWDITWTVSLDGSWGNTTGLRLKTKSTNNYGVSSTLTDYGSSLAYTAYALPAGKWTVIVHGKSNSNGEWWLLEFIGNGLGPAHWSNAISDWFDIQSHPAVPGGSAEQRTAWMWNLASRLATLSSGSTRIHRVSDREDCGFQTWAYGQQPGYGEFAPSDQGHNILLFDWDDASNFLDLDPLDADKDNWYAYAASDAVYTALAKLGAVDKLHLLIGYSRGAVVASETARRLRLAGHEKFQVLMLDAEGWYFYADREFHAWQGTRTDLYRSEDKEYYEILNAFCGGDPLPLSDHGNDRVVDDWPVGSNIPSNGLADIAYEFFGEIRHTYYPHYLMQWSFLGWDSQVGVVCETPEFYEDNECVKTCQYPTLVATSPVNSSDGLFNGTFRDGSAAGWTYHGGTTPLPDYDLWSVDVYTTPPSPMGTAFNQTPAYISDSFGDAVVAIDDADGVLRHNWMVKPSSAKFLTFSLSVDSFMDFGGSLRYGFEARDQLFLFQMGGFFNVSTSMDVGSYVDECGRIFVDASGIPQYCTVYLDNFEFVAFDPPEVDSLQGTPNPVDQGHLITLTATGVLDPGNFDIEYVAFYRDSNGNGELDYETDVLVGKDELFGDWRIAISSAGLSVGQQHRFFAVAVNEKGIATRAAEAAYTDVTVRLPANRPPVVGGLTDSPDPVERGQQLTLTAAGVSDPDGSVNAVKFYRDNGDGSFDANGDELLGQAAPSGSTASISVSTAGWAQASYRYFAVAADNGAPVAVSAPATCTGRVEKHWSLGYAVSPAGAGTVTQSPSAGQQLEGTQVAPSATANTGWFFDHWLLNGQPTGIPVALAANSTVTAVFSPVGTAPVILDVPNASAVEGAAYWGPVPSLAQGTAPITWSLVAAPSGVGIDPATGRVYWGSAVAAGSPHAVTIRAQNDWGQDDESWQVAVKTRTPLMLVFGNSVQIQAGEPVPSVDGNTDFGNVVVGAPAREHAFTIRNDGDAPLLLTGSPTVRILPDSGGFSITRTPVQTVEAHGGMTYFAVAFAPTVPGVQERTVSIETNEGARSAFTFTVRGTPQAAPPTFAPPSGTHIPEEGLDVTMVCATPGSSIWYTTDGSDPVCGGAGSTLYDGDAIHLTASTTIKAVGCVAGMSMSEAARARYAVCSLDVDESEFVDTLDVLFLYRCLVLGVSGDDIVTPFTPAVGAARIAENVAVGGTDWDVDGSGFIDSLDILFIYRHVVLGLSGNDLVAPFSPRRTPAEIAATIESLMP